VNSSYYSSSPLFRDAPQIGTSAPSLPPHIGKALSSRDAPQIGTSAPPSPPQNLRERVLHIGKALYIHKPEDWYQVPLAHVKLIDGGVSLLKQYLKEGKGVEGEGRRKMSRGEEGGEGGRGRGGGGGVLHIGKALYIHKLEDWYRLPLAHVKLVDGGASLLKQYLKKGEGVMS